MSSQPVTASEAQLRGYSPELVAKIRREEEARKQASILEQEIRAAFPEDIPRPRITLSVAIGYDDEWTLTEERLLHLADQDPEQKWTEVTDADVESCQEYFTFSDAEGWRFYLPAYLCHYLRHFPNSGWDAVHAACSSKKHVDLLTESQLYCLNRFMDLCHTYQQA